MLNYASLTIKKLHFYLILTKIMLLGRIMILKIIPKLIPILSIVEEKLMRGSRFEREITKIKNYKRIFVE